ncbi:MAG: [protein-PII] uridylyltransferase [Desulfovibrionaceae bacterium]|nr:[protein-PII] uridylyltransferase [Desulfovibrionaceae bacterium]
MDPQPGSAARLKRDRDGLFAAAAKDVQVLESLPGRNAAIADAYFAARLEEVAPPGSPLRALPFCVMALGGYGRGELSPASDLDVLVLFASSVPKQAGELARELFHPLWDLGLDLGHGVRDQTQCLGLAKEDHQVFASLLEARFLAGERSVFNGFSERFAVLAPDCGPEFIRRIAADTAEQDQTPNHDAALLEPDLKNDSGGLRDCQRIRWLLRPWQPGQDRDPAFSDQDLEDLEAARRLLLRARTGLQLITRRRQDRLHLDLQPDIARSLGYRENDRALAAERFLSDLHRAMTRIRAMRRAALHSVRPLSLPDGLNLPASIAFGPQGLRFADDRPLDQAVAADMFRALVETGLPLAWEARKAVEAFAAEGTDFPASRQTLDLFETVLTAPQGRAAAAAMLETGLIGAVFPEFGAVQDLVQFDAYHLHPLGRHTIEAVRGLVGFADPASEFHDILGRVKQAGRFQVLFWAVLFHDIAKHGPDHARKGAELAGGVLRRFGMDEAAVAETSLLIERHLLIPASASRIDLGSETEVSRLAETIATAQRLDMLELLSVADARATGPKAWNSWTRGLIRELCAKLRKLLTEGPLAQPHAAHQLLTARDRVRAKARGVLDSAFVERRLDTMPQRYLLSRPAVDVVKDLALIKRMEQALEKERVRRPGKRGGQGLTAIEMRLLETMGCRQVTLAAPNQPGLFAAAAGALSLQGMDVHAAELFTFTDDTVLDIFTVSAPPDILYSEETFARVGRSVHYALNGKLALGYRLEKLRSSPLVRRRKSPGPPPEVEIDNTGSDFHTILTVRADDRIGLLYDIAHTLATMFVQVHLAKIGTHLDRIEDTFHVRTDLGEKVTDREQIRELKAALTHALASRS